MQVKARDIIPGWPRGRSTTTAYANDVEARAGHLDLLRLFRRITRESAIALQCDIETDRFYHFEQQIMVQLYRLYEPMQHIPSWLGRRFTLSLNYLSPLDVVYVLNDDLRIARLYPRPEALYVHENEEARLKRRFQ